MRWRGYYFNPEDRPSNAELNADYEDELRYQRDRAEAQRIADLFLPSWRTEYGIYIPGFTVVILAFDENADPPMDQVFEPVFEDGCTEPRWL